MLEWLALTATATFLHLRTAFAPLRLMLFTVARLTTAFVLAFTQTMTFATLDFR